MAKAFYVTPMLLQFLNFDTVLLQVHVAATYFSGLMLLLLETAPRISTVVGWCCSQAAEVAAAPEGGTLLMGKN